MRTLMSLLMFVGCGSLDDDGPPSPRRCEQLRDHLVGLQLQDIHIASGIDREAHRMAMTSALGNDFVASCTGKLVDSQVTCALDATESVVAAACASTPSRR